MTLLLALLLTLPVLAGLLLLSAFPRVQGVLVVAAGWVTAAVTAVVAVELAAVVGRAPVAPTLSVPLLGPIAFRYTVDGLAAVLVVTVAVIGALVLLAAAGEPRLREGRFVGAVLVFVAAMLATVTAATLPALLAPWEVMGAVSWVLIAFDRRDPAVGPAATRAFLTTRTADVGLYVAVGAALAAGVPGLALAATADAPGGWRDLLAAGLVVAALGKSAQLPFSAWLSGAMVGPSPVSALLHSATMVAAGAVLLVRVGPLLAATGWAATLVAWVGALTAVVLGVVAATQRDLKQLLAASTCAQVGLMVLGAGVGATAGAAGLLVAHAAVKALLFLAAGGWLAVLRTRSLPVLRGAARRHPVVGVAFTVGAAALAGVPPLSIWWTKDAVLAGVPLGDGLLTVAGLLATALSAVAATRAAWFLWRPTRSPSIRRGADRPRRHVPVAVTAAVVVLAVPAAAVGGVGVWTGLVPRADAGELVTTGVVVVFAAAAAWALHSRPIRLGSAVLPRLAAAARGWLGLEAATRAVVVRPVLALARVLDRADGALGAALPRAAETVPRLAREVDRRGERPLAAAVSGVAGGVRRLGDLARRPQTGQQHQYYAQGVVVLGTLGVLVAVLVVTGVR
ncbi:proton-conducting transporter membrane subunit [Actinomycetospora sp. TBRC 11914]|uniref:proton-conducting transporter transmembrane domain-containing protein n=1 Tax=Actinomycetospora sp. TBRC 11914 TaxID=2729387 RepID=UPI00145D6450|nr:proton-conducting transporter membrane subunit [Actinomycetospora sp. TBRC 11914]NMO91122.1 NADH-quinone oxidoreductase subunit L [Actinomycetospora sp. TBRC 11914]